MEVSWSLAKTLVSVGRYAIERESDYMLGNICS
jgi:hypothetical protein